MSKVYQNADLTLALEDCCAPEHSVLQDRQQPPSVRLGGSLAACTSVLRRIETVQMTLKMNQEGLQMSFSICLSSGHQLVVCTVTRL